MAEINQSLRSLRFSWLQMIVLAVLCVSQMSARGIQGVHTDTLSSRVEIYTDTVAEIADVLSYSSHFLDGQESPMGRKLQQAGTNSTTDSSDPEDEKSTGWLKGVSFTMNWVLSYREISRLSHNLIFLGLAAIFMGFMISAIWMGCSMCLYPSRPAQQYRRQGKEDKKDDTAPVQPYSTEYNADTNEF